MAFAFPAYSNARIHPATEPADLRHIVKMTLVALNWPVWNETPEKIVARIGYSCRSWGEELIVHFYPDGTLALTSKCASLTQCLDWGKNKANIRKFKNEIRQHMETK